MLCSLAMPTISPLLPWRDMLPLYTAHLGKWLSAHTPRDSQTAPGDPCALLLCPELVRLSAGSVSAQLRTVKTGQGAWHTTVDTVAHGKWETTECGDARCAPITIRPACLLSATLRILSPAAPHSTRTSGSN